MKRALQEKGGAGGCRLCNIKDFSNFYILIGHFGLNVHVKKVNSIFVCIFSPKKGGGGVNLGGKPAIILTLRQLRLAPATPQLIVQVLDKLQVA